jgi:hypothetical protein
MLSSSHTNTAHASSGDGETKMSEISFSVTAGEAKTIRQIVARGWNIDWLRQSYVKAGCDKTSMVMDVTATHANGNPLRLADLLAADDFNFAHDMSGIANCLDRDTGHLTRNFRPRFSVPASQIEA